MRAIKSSIAETAARAKLRPGYLATLWRQAVQVASKYAADAALPYLEILRMPCYLVSVELHYGGERAECVFLVDANSGTVNQIDNGSCDFEDREVDGILSSALSESDAEEEVRKCLGKRALVGRASNGALRVGDTLRIEKIQYPYWVYYYERRAGKIDIRVLDATTGALTAHAIKSSILTVFSAGATIGGKSQPRARSRA